MIHRIKTAILAVYYSLRFDNSFTIRDGFLYFPSSAVWNKKNGVTKVNLNQTKEIENVPKD